MAHEKPRGKSPIVSTIIAALCIMLYIGALSYGALSIFNSVTERRTLADREFDGLADLASAAGVLGFMNEPFIQAIQDAIDGSETILGTVITGSKGEFAFERERGTVITWVNNSPRFVPRFAVTNPPKYLPLRIEGQRNANIYAVSGYLDYDYCLEILKRTLLLVLFSLTLAFFTLLMDALLAKNGTRPVQGTQPKAPPGDGTGLRAGPPVGERKPPEGPGEPRPADTASAADTTNTPDTGDTASSMTGAAPALEGPPEEKGPGKGERPGTKPAEPPVNLLAAGDRDDEDDLDFDFSEDDEFPDFNDEPSFEESPEESSLEESTLEESAPGSPADGFSTPGSPASGSPAPREEPEESPQDKTQEEAPAGRGEEQGLFSRRGNVGWESYTEDRLDSELHRCASAEQDLAFIICAFKEPEDLSKEAFRRFCEEAVTFFEHRDLIFEHGDQGLSIICPNYSLEQGIARSEEFGSRVLGKLFQPAGARMDLRFGLSSRSGRLIDAKRLMLEAGEALKRAAGDPASHVVAFKSDPEKYRQYIGSR
jgi:hypothetical protein